MKNKIVLTTTLIILFVASFFATTQACVIDPQLTANPSASYAATILVGSGFEANKPITIIYDDTTIATVPLSVKSNFDGAFSAFITVPDVLAVGDHVIVASDGCGNSDSTIFTVLDAKGDKGDTGAQGEQGLAGADGQNGINGLDGKDGLNGLNGKDGLDGVNGADFNATGNIMLYNGTDGKNGVDGKDGLNGVGLVGAKGDTGVQGPHGQTGTAGRDGKDGADGEDGKLVETRYNPSLVTTDISFMLAIGLVIALTAFASVVVLLLKKKP